MKSWKEEKSREASKETRTLHEDYLRPDYDDENYKEAYKYARGMLRFRLQSIYEKCCGPESKYHLGIGTFEELVLEATTDVLENFLDTVE